MIKMFWSSISSFDKWLENLNLSWVCVPRYMHIWNTYFDDGVVARLVQLCL